MLQKQQESCHDSSVCGLDLTLPLDFVRQWVRLTTKQHWTAKVKDCEAANNDVPSTEAVSPQQTFVKNEILPVHETDISVTTDVVCAQKTYLYAKITGVNLCMKEGRLQLSIVDVKIDSCDANTGLASPGDVDSQSPHSSRSQTCRHSHAAPVDCTDNILCKTLPESTAQLDIDPCVKSNSTSCVVTTHGTCKPSDTSTTTSDTSHVGTSAQSAKSITGTDTEGKRKEKRNQPEKKRKKTI